MIALAWTDFHSLVHCCELLEGIKGVLWHVSTNTVNKHIQGNLKRLSRGHLRD